MNYQQIYNDLIYKRKHNIIQSNYHKHHIIPKCIGGSNEKENLVRLSYREHYIAHLLLAKIYPNNYSLQCALQMMKNSIYKKGIKFNSYLYEHIIKQRNILVSIYSKQFMTNKTIYKNPITGEKRILSINDPLVLNGTFVGINKGNSLYSEKYKNKVTAKTQDGEVIIVSIDEFHNSNLVGINKGKVGLWDNYNELYNQMIWYDKIMFRNYNKTKIKKSSLVIMENIFQISEYIQKYFKNHPNRISFNYKEMKLLFPHIFYKRLICKNKLVKIEDLDSILAFSWLKRIEKS